MTVSGMLPSTPAPASPYPAISVDDARDDNFGPRDPFGRLVRIHRDTDRLLADLEVLRVQVDRAHAYVAAPGCNRALGLANLGRLRSMLTLALFRLSANRDEALQILSRLLLDPAASPKSHDDTGFRNSVGRGTVGQSSAPGPGTESPR